MDQVISCFFLILAIVSTAFFVYMFRYVRGFRDYNVVSVTGFLESTKLERNIFVGHPLSGKRHKHWTNYTYVYHVDKQEYRIRGGRLGQRKDIPYTVTIIVQKNSPQHAFIPQFEKAPSNLLWGFYLFACCFFYAFAIGAWYM
jgi:hypothetical protein